MRSCHVTVKLGPRQGVWQDAVTCLQELVAKALTGAEIPMELQALAIEIAVKLCRKHPLLFGISGATLARLCRQSVQPEDRLIALSSMALTLNPSKAPLTYLIKSVHSAVQLSLDALDPQALPLLTHMPLEPYSGRGHFGELILDIDCCILLCFFNVRFAWPDLCGRA